MIEINTTANNSRKNKQILNKENKKNTSQAKKTSLPASKVFDLKVIHSDKSNESNSTHSYCHTSSHSYCA